MRIALVVRTPGGTWAVNNKEAVAMEAAEFGKAAREQHFSHEHIRAVLRGASWLDKNHPGWERRIDPSWLDMSDGSSCVLGQVVPSDQWISGFDQVAADHTSVWINQHGFGAGHALQDCWLQLVKMRLDEGLPA